MILYLQYYWHTTQSGRGIQKIREGDESLEYDLSYVSLTSTLQGILLILSCVIQMIISYVYFYLTHPSPWQQRKRQNSYRPLCWLEIQTLKKGYNICEQIEMMYKQKAMSGTPTHTHGQGKLITAICMYVYIWRRVKGSDDVCICQPSRFSQSPGLTSTSWYRHTLYDHHRSL